MPILVALVALLFWRGLSRQHDVTPLLCVQAWFALCYAGLGISLWPLMVPPDITIWDARHRQRARVSAGRRGGADPDHPRLHGVHLLGVPREGAAGNALSLMATAGAAGAIPFGRFPHTEVTRHKAARRRICLALRAQRYFRLFVAFFFGELRVGTLSASTIQAVTFSRHVCDT